MTNIKDLLAAARAKLRKVENKATSKGVIVVSSRPDGSRNDTKQQLDGHVSRKTIIQQARLKAKESAVEIAQDEFIAKVAAMYQNLMQTHGPKMSGVRIIFACSKGEASSDYHIKIENYPQAPRTLHRADITSLAAKNVSPASPAPDDVSPAPDDVSAAPDDVSAAPDFINEQN